MSESGLWERRRHGTHTLGTRRHHRTLTDGWERNGYGRLGARYLSNAEHFKAHLLPVEPGIRWAASGSSHIPDELGAREESPEGTGRRSVVGQNDLAGTCRGTLLSPARRREAVVRVQQRLAVSERWVCLVLKHCRAHSVMDISCRAEEHSSAPAFVKQHGLRAVAFSLDSRAFTLRRLGRQSYINAWRECGAGRVKSASEAIPLGQCWLTARSCIRPYPEYPHHV